MEGKKLAEHRDQVYNEALRRRHLTQQDPGLRRMVKRLQAEYISKLQQHQILSNQYKNLQNKVEEAQFNRAQSSSLLAEQQEALCLEQEKSSRRTAYGCELQQQQMEMKKKKREEQYQDILVEKNRVDDVMKTLADEGVRELKQKQELKATTHNEMLTSQQARLESKEEQRRISEAEEAQIEQQIQEITERTRQILSGRVHKMKAKEEVHGKIAAKLLADEKERKEREEVISQLLQREYAEESLNNEMLTREKEKRDKREKMQELKQQVENRSRLVQDHRGVDERYKRSVRFLDSDGPSCEETRNLVELSKKEIQRQYAEDLLQQIEDNRRRKRERDGDETK